jgi:ABC-type nickel/cobalt efflux system permease component RcnA
VTYFCKRKISFFLCLIVILTAGTLWANPFFTPNGTASESTAETQCSPPAQKKKKLNPVRVAGASRQLVKKQGSLREQLAGFFIQLNSDTNRTSRLKLIIIIFAISFIYGSIHAAGPGHRKTIVFSLYLTRNAPWWEPLTTALILAFLHGSSAIVIMYIFKGIAGSITRNTDNLAVLMEGISYLIIISITVWLIIQESFEYFQQNQERRPAVSEKFHLVPFLISGIYPCPGAILVLVFCFTQNMLNLGAASILFMSLGMTVPIAAAGYLAWAGRTGLFHALKAREKTTATIAYAVQMAGFSVLLVFSLYISWPFIVSFL